MAVLEGLRFDAVIDTSKYESGLKKMQNETNNFDQSIKKLGKTLVGVFGTIGIGYLMKQAGQSFLKFDKAIANVATMSSANMHMMRESVLDLSVATAQSATTMAEALYMIVSSGYDAAEALYMLQGSAQAATAGASDVFSAANAIISTMAAYNIEVKDLNKVLDLHFATLKKGRMDYTQLAHAVGFFLPQAAQLGSSIEEAMGAFAYVTKTISPDEAKTSLNAIYKSLAQNVDKFKELGIQLYDSQGKFIGLTNVAEQTQKALKGLSDEQRTAFVQALGLDIRAARAFNLMISNAEGFKEVVDDVTNSTNSLITALETQESYVYRTYERMSEAIKKFGIKAGEKLMRALEPLALFITDLAEAFSSMLDEPKVGFKKLINLAQETWDSFGKIGKAVTLVIGAFIGFEVAALSWSLLTKAILSGGTIILGIFSAIFSWPFLLMAALYTFRVAWRHNWLGVRDTLIDVWGAMQPVIDFMKNAVSGLGDSFANIGLYISNAFDWIKDNIIDSFGWINKFWTWLIELFQREPPGDDSPKIIDWVINAFEKLKDSIGTIDLGKVKGVLEWEGFEKGAEWVTNLYDEAKAWTRETIGAVVDITIEAAKVTGQVLWEGFVKGANWFIDLYTDVRTWAKEKIGQAVSLGIEVAKVTGEVTYSGIKAVAEISWEGFQKAKDWPVDIYNSAKDWVEENIDIVEDIPYKITVFGNMIWGGFKKGIGWVVDIGASAYEWTKNQIKEIAGIDIDITSVFAKVNVEDWDWTLGKNFVANVVKISAWLNEQANKAGSAVANALGIEDPTEVEFTELAVKALIFSLAWKWFGVPGLIITAGVSLASWLMGKVEDDEEGIVGNLENLTAKVKAKIEDIDWDWQKPVDFTKNLLTSINEKITEWADTDKDKEVTMGETLSAVITSGLEGVTWVTDILASMTESIKGMTTKLREAVTATEPDPSVAKVQEAWLNFGNSLGNLIVTGIGATMDLYAIVKKAISDAVTQFTGSEALGATLGTAIPIYGALKIADVDLQGMIQTTALITAISSAPLYAKATSLVGVAFAIPAALTFTQIATEEGLDEAFNTAMKALAVALGIGYITKSPRLGFAAFTISLFIIPKFEAWLDEMRESEKPLDNLIANIIKAREVTEPPFEGIDFGKVETEFKLIKEEIEATNKELEKFGITLQNLPDSKTIEFDFGIPDITPPAAHQTGGYTGNVGLSKIAGVVHGGEWVAPAWLVRKYPALIAMMEGIRNRGYQQGGVVGDNPQSLWQIFYSGLTSVYGDYVETIASDVEKLKAVFEKIFGLAGIDIEEPMQNLEEAISGFEDIKEYFEPTKKSAKELSSELQRIADAGRTLDWTSLEILETQADVLRDRIDEATKSYIENNMGVEGVNEGLKAFKETIADDVEKLKMWEAQIDKITQAMKDMESIQGLFEQIAGESTWLTWDENKNSQFMQAMLGLVMGTEEAGLAIAEAGATGAMAISSSIGLIIGFFSEFFNQLREFEGIMAILNPFKPLLEGIFATLGPVLHVFDPLVDILYSFGSIIGAVVSVFLQLLSPLQPLISMFQTMAAWISWVVDKGTLMIDNFMRWLSEVPGIGRHFEPILTEEERKKKSKTVEDRLREYEKGIESKTGTTFTAGSQQNITYNNQFIFNEPRILTEDDESIRKIADLIVANLEERGMTLVVR